MKVPQGLRIFPCRLHVVIVLMCFVLCHSDLLLIYHFITGCGKSVWQGAQTCFGYPGCTPEMVHISYIKGKSLKTNCEGAQFL